MNARDLDPNLYLPVLRSVYRALRRSLRKLFRPAEGRTAPPAGCRG